MFRSLAALVALSLNAAVLADGAHHHHEPASKSFGRQGDAKQVSRTIRVEMTDQMRFTPAALTVRQGETIRFRVKNTGKVMHEMVLGTLEELKEHAEMMKKEPRMAHHEPNAAHVAPGKTGTLVWRFTDAGEFHYGCLVPGHFDAGMIGTLTVTPAHRH